MQIFLILSIPLVLTAVTAALRNRRAATMVNAGGHAGVFTVAVALAAILAEPGTSLELWGMFYADSLSALFILMIATVNLASAMYSMFYVASERHSGLINDKTETQYMVFFNLFAFVMLAVPVTANLGLMWVTVELTTLVSAFLVGFHRNKESVEAAWKYVIICSVGLTFALLGIIFLYHTVSADGGIRSLDWADIMAVADKLDPKTVKLAFIFAVVGFGTKAGLVPMHTWLPDAHSQAPAPISAMLSGVLLKTSIFAILRISTVAVKPLGPEFVNGTLLAFGLISLGVAAVFMLVQRDLKRLLAYSSIEHMGIICLGFGFAGPFGLYGSLLHCVNHAAAKPMMFFAAGNISERYGTNKMRNIRGVLKAMPLTGVIVLVGAFAMAGSPPFSMFTSKLMILNAGYAGGNLVIFGVALAFMAVAFGAFIYHFGKICFGTSPELVKVEPEPALSVAPSLVMLAALAVLPFYMPEFLFKLLGSAAQVLRGV